MYQISKFSNKIKNTITNEIFLMDDRDKMYPDYLLWLNSGGEPDILDLFDSELQESKRPLIEEIDRYYTKLISEFLSKWIEKKEFGEISEYPAEVENERNRLRDLCNAEIEALGIDVTTYRKTKRETITLNKF